MTIAKLDEANYINNKIKEIDDMLGADGILTIHKANNTSKSVRYATGVDYDTPGNGIITLIKAECIKLIGQLEKL